MSDIHVSIDHLNPPDWRYENGGSILSAGLNDFYAEEYPVTTYEWIQVATWANNNGYTDIPMLPPFSQCGYNLPVTMVSYLDVLKWCNAKSEKEGKKPVYWLVQDVEVFRAGSRLPIQWSILDDYTYSRDGYRLPHDNEWIYIANNLNGNANFLNSYPGIATENDFSNSSVVHFDNSAYSYIWCESIASQIFIGGSLTISNPLLRGPKNVYSLSPSPAGFVGLCGNVSEYVYRNFDGNCLPNKYVRAFGGNFLNTRRELKMDNSVSSFSSRSCILSPNWVDYSTCGHPNTFKIHEKRAYVGFRTFRTDINISYSPFSPINVEEPINLRSSIVPLKPMPIRDGCAFGVGSLGSVKKQDVDGKKFTKIDSSFLGDYFVVANCTDSYDPFVSNPVSGYLSKLDYIFPNTSSLTDNNLLFLSKDSFLTGAYINSLSAGLSSTLVISGKSNNPSGFRPGVVVSGYDQAYTSLVSSANYSAIVGASEIFSSNESAFLLLDSGKVTGWGWNEYGQINPQTGLNNSNHYFTGNWNSTLIGSLTGIKKVGCSVFQTIFLFEDGRVSGIGYSGYNGALQKICSVSGAENIFVKKDYCFISYRENANAEDLILTGYSLWDLPNGQLESFANGLRNVIDFDLSSKHCVVLFNDYTVTGLYFSVDELYCGEAEFREIDYPVYGVYAANGATLLKRDVGIQPPISGKFSIQFINYNQSVTGLDCPVSDFSIEASIPKNIIRHEDNRFSWFYSPQDYDLKLPTGSYFDDITFYLSVSGASFGSGFYENSGGRYEYLRNPAIEIYKKNESGQTVAMLNGNEFWQDLEAEEVSRLLSANFIDSGTFSSIDPALLVDHSFSDTNIYGINIIEKNSSRYKNWSDFYMRDNFPSRYKFNLKFDPVKRGQSKKITNEIDESFIDYNVSGDGVYTKNIIGYNIEFLESTFSPAETITEDISNLIYTPILGENPQCTNGLVDHKQTITSFCIDTLNCPEAKDMEPEMTCWSGRNITGMDYQRFFANFVANLGSGLSSSQSSVVESNKFLKNAEHDVFFYQWTGFIAFNDFIKGDVIEFNPYNFGEGGYYQHYSSYYKSEPPYANLEKFSLKFKSDFADPTGLIDALNERFSGYSYQKIWYPYYCPTGIGKQGVFVDVGNSLAHAEIVHPGEFYGYVPPNSFIYTGSGQLQSEQEKWDSYLSTHSGRVIKITSNHYHESGHNLSLRLGNVRSSVQTKIQRGNAYLLPTHFELHGSMDGHDWHLLDLVSGFEWSGIESKAGSEPPSLKDFKPDEEFDIDKWLEDQIDIKNSLPGRKEDILKYTRKKIEKRPPWCGGNKLVENEGTLFWFADVPPNFPEKINLCSGDKEKGEGEKEDEGKDDPAADKDKASSYYKAMGSLLKPELLNVPDHYYLRYVNYNFYKLKFKNFENEATGSFLNPLDEFKVKRITFYSAVDSPPILLQGENECVIGSDYSIDISGYVPVIVTGYFTGEIGASESGRINANNVWIEGHPKDLSSGDWVKFNKESGRLVSDLALGTIQTGFYLTGTFSTGAAGWYYNPSNNQITLFKNFSTVLDSSASGSGFYEGQYIQLKEEVVSRELAVGGFMQPGFLFTGVTGVYFTSNVTGLKSGTNLTGCFEKDILITGSSKSGYFDYSSIITGSASGKMLIYGEPTGFIPASGVINYIYPSVGDYIVLNEEKISFNPDRVNFSQPYYFDSFDTLANTLTGQEYSYLFNSSFSVEKINNKIYVYSKLPGNSGNNTSFYYYSTGGLFTEPSGFLSGGEDLNQYIIGLNDSVYSGEINLPSIPITGFYNISSSGSGYIYGYVQKLLGVRNFMDVWSLYSGLDPAFDNMYLISGNSGDSYVSGNYTGELLGLYPEMVNLNLFYNDIFSTSRGAKDVVRLGVFDSNYSGSGVYHVITSE